MSFLSEWNPVAGADDRYSFEPQRSNVRTGKELYYGDREVRRSGDDRSGKGVVDIRKQEDRGGASVDRLYVECAVADGFAGRSLYRNWRVTAENGVAVAAAIALTRLAAARRRGSSTVGSYSSSLPRRR